MSVCQICGEEEATIKTIDIVNNVKSEQHICESCYKISGQSQPFSVPNISDFVKLTPTSAQIDLQGLGELVKGLAKGTPEPDVPHIVCEFCGTTLEEFRKRGVVGCAADYDLFFDEILKLAVRLHGAAEHEGKVPREIEAERARHHRAHQLQTDLETAINEERYEEAASLRDRIQALMNGGASDKPHDAIAEDRDEHAG
ncbi:MAG: protein arginine kinase activator [Planctomycetota bacterium]|jgi:protein arginine kinase activator